MKITMAIIVAVGILFWILYSRVLRRMNPFVQRLKLVDCDGEERFITGVLLSGLAVVLIVIVAISSISEVQQKIIWFLIASCIVLRFVLGGLKETITEKYIFSRRGVFYVKDIIGYKFVETVDEKLLGESKPIIKFKNYDKSVEEKNKASDFLVINLKTRNKAEELTYESKEHEIALRVPLSNRKTIEKLLE